MDMVLEMEMEFSGEILWTWLVGGWGKTHLKNMSSSIGMMNFPIYGNMKNVPNHQPDDNMIWIGLDMMDLLKVVSDDHNSPSWKLSVW